MAKSLRSKKERAKRQHKRETIFIPRERARLHKMAQAAIERESREALELRNKISEGTVRRRRKIVRHNHVRSMRSGPKAYQIDEIVDTEYTPKMRDYERILDENALDSDDKDLCSDSDQEFQSYSRSQDRITDKSSEALLDKKIVSYALGAYLRKHRTLPRWAKKKDRNAAKRMRGQVKEFLREGIDDISQYNFSSERIK